ncbi:MAG TPA: EAL domain-containing protein [Noviherbaspirillum sp.]|nr:EAL domain-containing protein [Noviherbaspirillum sp.]
MIEELTKLKKYPPKMVEQLHTLQAEAAKPYDKPPFRVQPLLSPHNVGVFGYEVLYGGVHPSDALGWVEVDYALLRYLARYKMNASLFVNLSNQTILSIDEELLRAAHACNDLYFEWSEVVAEESQFKEIIRRINRWTERGLRFVIDDFGTGRDGFERMFAVERITALKIDGGFFRMASKNSMARNLVANVINECAKKSILTVAECVETEDDFRLAQSIGFDLVQGYYVDDVYTSAMLPKQA